MSKSVTMHALYIPISLNCTSLRTLEDLYGLSVGLLSHWIGEIPIHRLKKENADKEKVREEETGRLHQTQKFLKHEQRKLKQVRIPENNFEPRKLIRIEFLACHATLGKMIKVVMFIFDHLLFKGSKNFIDIYLPKLKNSNRHCLSTFIYRNWKIVLI